MKFEETIPFITPGVLTIGIPTYNSGSQLSNVLASIDLLNLDSSEYEILIVDNCSTDNTEEVVTLASERFNNLRYIRNATNIGRIPNWNEVIRNASGEFLLIMNSNDRFVNFEVSSYLGLLKRQPEIALLFTDIKFTDHVYPAWKEEGTFQLNSYLRKTMLDTEYLEFHSLGLLQQHIFRTGQLRTFKILFDPSIPRTTDRVFVGEAIKAGGGSFYYVPKAMVCWHMSDQRYHYGVHKGGQFNFDELWGNEFRANMALAKLADIPPIAMIQAQLKSAAFHSTIAKLRHVKEKYFRQPSRQDGLEVPTAKFFYSFLKQTALRDNVRISPLSACLIAIIRVARWYFRSLKVIRYNSRSLSSIIEKP
jgi:glycosyltransferase involved in cell wall biosynthesis